MSTFKLFRNTFYHIFYILFLRNPINYLLLFFSLILFSILLFPIFQTELQSLRQTNKIVAKSGPFDFFFKLPSRTDFKKLQTNNANLQKFLSIKEFLQSEVFTPQILQKHNVNPLLIRKTKYTDLQRRKYFVFETAFFNEQFDSKKQISNKVVLSKGRMPSSNPAALEIVLNSKFAELNNVRLGDEIPIFDFSLTVVGMGDAVHNLSSNFIDTSLVQISFNLTDKDNLHKHFGIIYAHENLFEDFYFAKSTPEFNNFSNFLYFSSSPGVDANTARNFYLQKIIDSLKYHPESFSFYTDISSGAKKVFLGLSLTTIGVFYFFAFVLLLIWLSYICQRNLFQQKTSLSILNLLGIPKNIIAFSCFLTNFLLLFFVSVIGFLLSFSLTDYFVNFNNQISFISLRTIFFDWWPFLGQIIFFPLILATASAFFIRFKLSKINYIFGEPKVDIKNSAAIISARSEQVKWSIFTFAKTYAKAIVFFLFSNIWRKLLLIFFISLFFLFFFFFTFAKSTVDNFIYHQWNFLTPQVTNFVKLKRHISFDKNSDHIKSDVDFLSTDSRQLKNLNRINKLNDVTIDPSFLDPSVIIEKSLKKWYIDRNIESKAIRGYMQNFDIDKIYFNILPYERNQDFLTMIADAPLHNQNVKIYFLPRNWQQFFQIDNLEAKLDNFQLQADGSIGVDSAGIQYGIFDYSWKSKGYQLGDLVTFEDISFDRINLKKRTQFRIAGFTNRKFLISNHIFTDYDYLLTNRIVPGGIEKNLPYNFLFSRANKKHISRFLTLNFSRIPLNVIQPLFQQSAALKLDALSLTNIESLYLSEFRTLSDFHFRLYRKYILFVFLLSFLFVLSFLIIILNFAVDDRILSGFLLWGYRIGEMLRKIFFGITGLLLAGFAIAIAFSYLIFTNLFRLFESYNIYLPFPDLPIYFWYAGLLMVVVFILFLLYKWWLLKKTVANWEYS